MASCEATSDEVLASDSGIYLDYNASAPLRGEARAAMIDWLDPQRAGNPHSVHRAGRTANAAVERARRQVARLLNCAPREIIFTSGATEANNLALHAALSGLPPGAALVTSAVEHPAVLDAVRAHGRLGRSTHIVGVDDHGRLDYVAYRSTIDGTIGGCPPLVSIMAANNETGVLNDLSVVVQEARRVGAVIHTDATQLVGRLPVDVRELDVDLLSLSAHKFGGPQGVGALYISRRAGLAIEPLQHGGGQELGWRPGTLNVAGIAGLGAAAEAASRDLATEPARVAQMRDDLEAGLRATLPWVRSNGAGAERLPGVVSMTFPGMQAEALIAAMPELAVSEGSACATGAPEPSHVLTAMGLDRDLAEASLRFSLGHASQPEDIDGAIAAVLRAVRAISEAMAATDSPQPTGARSPCVVEPPPDHEGNVGAGV